MAGEKNFNVKNGLSVGGVEVIDSNGDIVAAGVGTAVNEAIADKIGGIISATGGATATYNDGADTIVIDVPITDEDNMASNSATAIASQQSIKAYVDSQVTAQDLDVATDSGTIDIDLDSESITIAGGAGIDTSATGTTVTIAGELATETNAGIATFDGTDFTVSSGDVTVNAERIQDIVGAMVSSNTESGITVAYEDGDGTIDFTVGTLNQDTTGTAAIGTSVTVSANNSTDETVYPTFVDGATGTQGIETDTGLTYNPSSGILTTTSVTGNLTGNVTGNADTATTATTATNVTASANNSTDETVYPTFVDGATGAQGIETDTGLTYNPSDGNLTSTTFTGNLTGNVTGNASGTAATVTGAAQTNITSLGTLTALTVDNVVIDGAVIGHTGDTDLITLSSGVVTVAGEVDATSLDVSGDADIDGTLEADAITVNGSTLASVIAGTTVANATLAATTTVSDSTANTNFPVVFHDESNALLDDTGALRYNPSTGELLVPNLTVAGTTTTANTVTMEASNAIIFEGATADSNETTLSIVDPTADHTQYLINQGGYIPVLAAATTTAITSTPAELNLLDTAAANTVVNSKAVIYGSGGELAGTLSTAAQGNVTSLGTLTALTVDNVVIDGAVIGHTGDTDLITLSSGVVTVAGEVDATSLDVSGDADIDGTLEADAYTVGGTALNEYIQDTVGAMVSSNTETGISVSYEDGDGTLDFVVGTLNQNTTGNAATATALATARNIGGVSFDGTANIDLPGVNSAGNQNTSGTAAGLSGTPNISVGTIASGAITITNATNSGGTARNVFQSTSAPSGGDGAVGDLWILYS